MTPIKRRIEDAIEEADHLGYRPVTLRLSKAAWEQFLRESSAPDPTMARGLMATIYGIPLDPEPLPDVVVLAEAEPRREFHG